jgi:hypothetical protein
MNKRLRYQMIRSAAQRVKSQRRMMRLNVELEKEIREIEEREWHTLTKNSKKL